MAPLPPPTLPARKERKAWRWIAGSIAAFIIVGVLADMGDTEPDPPPARTETVADNAARQAWFSQSQADRDLMCDGYRTLPRATVRAMMEIGDRQLEDAVMRVIEREC